MEEYPDPEKIESQALLVRKMREQIQVKLMQMSLKEGSDRTVQTVEWAVKNGGLYMRAFDELLQGYPNLIEEWEPEKDFKITNSIDEVGKIKTDVEIGENPKRENILRMIKERIEEIKQEKLDKAA
jgi:hypothetical protein